MVRLLVLSVKLTVDVGVPSDSPIVELLHPLIEGVHLHQHIPHVSFKMVSLLGWLNFLTKKENLYEPPTQALLVSYIDQRRSPMTAVYLIDRVEVSQGLS